MPVSGAGAIVPNRHFWQAHFQVASVEPVGDYFVVVPFRDRALKDMTSLRLLNRQSSIERGVKRGVPSWAPRTIMLVLLALMLVGCVGVPERFARCVKFCAPADVKSVGVFGGCECQPQCGARP